MAIDIKNIGVFGISFTHDMGQTWFLLFRKEDRYSMDLLENIDNPDSDEYDEVISTEKKIPFEMGESILRNIFGNGHLEEWKTQYWEEDEGPDSELHWTNDVDDLNDVNLMMLSGNRKLPPNQWMHAVIEAARAGEPRFAKCFKDFAKE